MHQKLGRHELHGVPMKINMDVLTYNSLNGNLFLWNYALFMFFFFKYFSVQVK